MFNAVVFWAVGSSWLTNSHRRFEGSQCLRLQCQQNSNLLRFLAQNMKAIPTFETSKAFTRRQNITNPQDSVFSITTTRISIYQIRYLFVGNIRPCKFWLFHTYRNKSSKCLTIVTVVIFIVWVTENSADILHSKNSHILPDLWHKLDAVNILKFYEANCAGLIGNSVGI
jgi:hypothetical protein